jgi:transposase
MRGQVDRQRSMFVALDVEQRVPEDHPLRAVKAWCDEVLASMSREFDRAYGTRGQVSVPPESLLKALLLRALFGIPSERRLCEACEYNLLYRWFIDWPIERVMWTPEVFSVNRERFERHGFIETFFGRVVEAGIGRGLVSDDRFNVDGTLMRSLAGHKSVKPMATTEGDDDHPAEGEEQRDLNGWGQFKKSKRSNATHRSIVDPDARLASRGGEAHPSHSMHVLTDADSGLCLSLSVDEANGTAERANAIAMLDQVHRRHRLKPRIIAADAGYGTGDFLCAAEDRGITPHAAMPAKPIQGDSQRHLARRRMKRRFKSEAYRTSQRLRRLIEPMIGWCKDIGGLRRTRFLGRQRIQDDALMVATAWNLMRMTRLT